MSKYVSNPITAEMFDKLYRNGFDRTCSIFHKMGFNPDDCQDLAQEVYLLVWKKRELCVGAPYQFWKLQLYQVIYNIKVGKYTSGIDESVTVRNFEQNEGILGYDPPTDEQFEVKLDFLLRALPEVLRDDLLLELAGYTYKERYLILGIHPTKYSKIRAALKSTNIQALLDLRN